MEMVVYNKYSQRLIKKKTISIAKYNKKVPQNSNFNSWGMLKITIIFHWHTAVISL